VPLGNVLAGATGSWHSVFLAAAAMNLVAALAAPFVLRPMRQRHAASLAATTAAAGRIPRLTNPI
jgi:OFA family oxalate/formate antiporter-like MFS transporter